MCRKKDNFIVLKGIFLLIFGSVDLINKLVVIIILFVYNVLIFWIIFICNVLCCVILELMLYLYSFYYLL